LSLRIGKGPEFEPTIGTREKRVVLGQVNRTIVGNAPDSTVKLLGIDYACFDFDVTRHRNRILLLSLVLRPS
jgi:hypothetical protein